MFFKMSFCFGDMITSKNQCSHLQALSVLLLLFPMHYCIVVHSRIPYFLLIIVGICSEFLCVGFLLSFRCLFLVLYSIGGNVRRELYFLLHFSFQARYQFCRLRFASYMTFITMLNQLHSEGSDYTMYVKRLHLINYVNKYISLSILLEYLK